MPKKKTAKTTSAKAKPPKPKATKPAKAPAAPTDTAKLLKFALAELKSLGNEKVRAQNAKHGACENQFGVSRGDLRIVANKFKTNHELALALWETDNIDAQFLATLLMKPALLSSDEMVRLMISSAWVQVADWLHSYVLKEHADKESLREKWMRMDVPLAARAGWRLTAGRVAKNPEGLDLVALLDRIEREMGSAAEEVQWTMNTCLAEIGINHPKLRKRALAIGENLGLYRDYPTSKGCTSLFAPIWINAMVARQK